MSEENERQESRFAEGRRININFFWFIIIILTSIIATAVITALSLEAGSEKAVNVGTDTRSEFAKLYNVYDTINANYYDEVDREALIESSIQGMVEGLDDPYSEYMNNEELAQFQESVTGDFEGIGAEVMQEGNRVIITSPMRGSPAEEAGLEPGDEIIAVDGESIEGWTTQEAVQLIRGEKGTDVVLTIVRGEGDPMDVTITRDTIHIDSVTYEEVEGVGHISINRFQEGTTEEFENMLNAAAEDDVEDVIIDFRYNPGGLLDEAVSMINQFIDQNETVLYLEENGGERTEIKTTDEQNPNTDDFNVYILINEGSASASEVFTGALDDLTDATVAGTQSFGKGVVQRTVELGDDSLLKYTNTKWLTPDGTWIHGGGITPDIQLVNPDYYRVEMLNPDEVYTEDVSNDTVKSIKVALDTLGYEIDDFDETFDASLTAAVESFQADQDLEQSGDVTGETSTAMMSELRDYINSNDAQLNYLVDFINEEYTEKEIETYADERAQHLEIEEREDHSDQDAGNEEESTEE
ncbi:S41 family peptidase [Salinicoccus hispanicus]|uniref:Probable CtpA-like serine protease n=1 Tax=Salinicoccus hispanicus TaxID=157225 RepID=A0A6N8TZ44_9STAP|nr:S41 family peptidase [Salinicoccus hispanicus]MXQ50317.1 PDZ domain-containing protein [Salinicoccus hispanicus]